MAAPRHEHIPARLAATGGAGLCRGDGSQQHRHNQHLQPHETWPFATRLGTAWAPVITQGHSTQSAARARGASAPPAEGRVALPGGKTRALRDADKISEGGQDCKMKSVRTRFFPFLFFSQPISGAALQEEKLVGICAPLLPSPGLYQYAGPVTSIKGLCCLCTVKVTAAPRSAERPSLTAAPAALTPCRRCHRVPPRTHGFLPAVVGMAGCCGAPGAAHPSACKFSSSKPDVLLSGEGLGTWKREGRPVGATASAHTHRLPDTPAPDAVMKANI